MSQATAEGATMTIPQPSYDHSISHDCSTPPCEALVEDRLPVGWVRWGGRDNFWGDFFAQLEFDLSSVPVGQSIDRADLVLYFDGICIGNEFRENACLAQTLDLELHQILSQSPFDTSVADSVPLDTTESPGWISWDMTTIVQDWRNGAPNLGVIVKPRPAAVDDGPSFPSSEFSNVSLRPQLIIEYGSTTTELTEAERTRAIGIATSDPRFVTAIGGRQYSVMAVRPWLRMNDGDKLGAALVVELAQPAFLEADWPAVVYDESEAASPPYSQEVWHYAAQNVTELYLQVDLTRDELVMMEPGGDAEIIEPMTQVGGNSGFEPMNVPAEMGAGRTSRLRRIFVGADWFWNYDFTTFEIDPSSVAARSKVDWPVGLIFWDNADVNKPKEDLGSGWDPACEFAPGICPFNQTASEMYARIHDGFGDSDPREPGTFHGTTWDADKGAVTGSVCIGTKRHFRIYAPSPEVGGDDRMYNLTWSYYIIATAHKDVREGRPFNLCAGWSGDSEAVENEVARDARERGWVVQEDVVNLYNSEDPRPRGRRHYRNNGLGTKIKIP